MTLSPSVDALDPDIPTLKDALDPATMLPVLRSLPLLGAVAPNATLTVEVKRQKDGRHWLLLYTLQSPNATPLRIYGKVFAKLRRSQRLWRILEAVDAQSTPPRPAPGALAHVEHLNLVLMECVPGLDMRELLENGTDAERLDAIHLAAAALVRFHATVIDDGKPGDIDEEVESFRKHLAEFGSEAPEFVAPITALIDGIERHAQRLPAPPPCVIHGGVRPDSIIVSPERAAIVDLDGWTLGDPALDAGSFLVDLWERSARPGSPDLTALRRPFLDAYLALVEGPTPHLAGRIQLYQAFAFVHLALRRLRSLSRQHDRSKAAVTLEELLREAALCLKTLEAS